jgi:transposase, IS30 family
LGAPARGSRKKRRKRYGAEFHGYRLLEKVTGIPFYFAHPHHSWERGTNQDTNGLIRHYLPKGKDLADLTQDECDRIATILNKRPRKRHNYRTPREGIPRIF